MVEQRGRGRRFGAARMGAAGWWVAAMWLAAGCATGAGGQVEPLPPLPQPTVTGAASSSPPSPPAPELPQSSIPAARVPPSAWSPEQSEVIAAFEAAEMAFRMARMEPIDLELAAVRATHTEEAMADVRTLVERRRRDHQAVRWPKGIQLVARYEAVEVDGAHAVISGCKLDDGVLYEIETGVVLEGAAVPRGFVSTLEFHEGEWLLAGFAYVVLEDGSCVAS